MASVATLETRSPSAVGDPDRVETPAYVYDLDEVRRAHALLRAALPQPSRLFYSLKANPHPAIVRALTELGCAPEVSSPGELHAALAAGASPRAALYTGPGKRDAEVADALAAGVRSFSVDSPRGLEQLRRAAGAIGTTTRCLLRVNDAVPVAGQGLAMTGTASQFGADATWVEQQPARFTSRPGAEVVGFHLYMGTNLEDEDALVAQFAAAISTARRLADVLQLDPEVVDLGGGFPAPFARAGALIALPTLAGRVADLLDGAFPGWRDGRPEIAFESGRYLVATCGELLTRVVDVKRSHGRPVVVLESGINHLGGMSGLRRLPPLVPDLCAASRDDEPALREAIVAGPLCTPLDTWARSADLPDARVGDVVRVPNVGAYGLSASLLAFLGHPTPREIVVDGGDVVDVSQLALMRTHVTNTTADGRK